MEEKGIRIKKTWKTLEMMWWDKNIHFIVL